MKSFIFVLCFAFSAAVYAQEDSISVINSSADLACKNNPDAASKESCKELLLSTAAFASENANGTVAGTHYDFSLLSRLC